MSAAQACDCVAKIDRLAENEGWRVGVGISLAGGTFVCIVTERHPNAPRRGKRPPLLAASFCPFCGVKCQSREKISTPIQQPEAVS